MLKPICIDQYLGCRYTEHITQGLEGVGQAIVDVQIGKNEGKSVVIVAEE
jgi:NADPH-dependent curcumin reductase CurA